MVDAKIVYILRGASGSGKTTLALKLAPKEQVFSADNFPGLYDGGYQIDKQAASHKWCKDQFEIALKEGLSPLCVANTNMKTAYVDGFLGMAKAYGYAMHIIHCEQLLLPDGTVPKNEHNTPAAVIRSQLDGFQLMESPVPGITVSETCAGIKALKHIESKLVISDLVGTLIRPSSPHRFINQADQAEPIESVLRALSLRGVGEIAIASNQMGVGGGHFRVGELEKLAKLTEKWLLNYGIDLKFAVFATHRNSKSALIYERGGLSDLSLSPRADKPSSAMLEYIMKREGAANAVYLGDAHHVGRAEDIETVRRLNIGQLGLTYARKLSLTYIPMEALS